MNYWYLRWSMAAPIMLWLTATITGIAALITLKLNNSILLDWNMLSLMSTPLSMSLILDKTGLMYSTVVMIISANVLKFSKSYMKNDLFIERFTILVILFIISMNMLIFIPHFMALLLGWDGLGITSFILVVYYQNPKSLAAGMITALTNRIGDVMILLAIALTLHQGHWSILYMMNTSFMPFQVLMILIAAMTKSAQMPFSSWLPAAMAAPTPVSALVHSSTLVTAGVFILIRFYPFLSCLNMFNTCLLLTAVSTMLMAGISATSECDMKKIIALSTLSQLGMMMTSLGLGLPELAFFHMMTHALFKALLFICAGNFITMHSHAQDLRWMGNMTQQAPTATSCILIANSALCGIPFMSGFYSKDLILENLTSGQYNYFMVLLTLLAVGFTAFYSIRFSLVMMWGPRNYSPLSNSKESMNVIIPISIMSTLSIIGGTMLLWMIPTMSNPHLSLINKLAPFMIMTIGIMIGWTLSISKTIKFTKYNYLSLTHFASCMMWFLVPMASQMQLKLPLWMAHMTLKSVDHAWLEMMNGQGLNFLVANSSNIMMTHGPTTPTTYLTMTLLSMSLISLFLLMI